MQKQGGRGMWQVRPHSAQNAQETWATSSH